MIVVDALDLASVAFLDCRSYGRRRWTLDAARSGSWRTNDFFQFGFRRVVFFWPSLPVGMRHLLCQLADIDVARAEYLMQKRGFVIPGRESSGGPVPWSEIRIVEDWTDPDAN